MTGGEAIQTLFSWLLGCLIGVGIIIAILVHLTEKP